MTRKAMTVVGAQGNRTHGHIAIGIPNERCTAAFIDTGGRLEWWAYNRGELDPAGARALATELLRWAKRAEERQAAARRTTRTV